MQSSPSQGTHWPSLLLLIAAGLGFVAALAVAGVMFTSGLVGFVGPTELPAAGLQGAFQLAWASLAVALLMLPAAAFSLLRLIGKPLPSGQWKGRFLLATVLLLVWPLIVALSGALEETRLAWLFLPPLNLLAVLIPIAWYLEFARRGLDVNRPQRTWATYTFSALLTMPLILLLELLVIIGLIAGFAIWLAAQPGLAFELTVLVERLQNLPTGPTGLDPALFAGLGSDPIVILLIIFTIAGLTPLLEEAFKPLAVWLFAGRDLTPAQGFWLGAVSGASFALLETLGALGSVAQAGVITVLLGRLGTGLLHIVTAALTGWGLAVAVRSGRYGRLALAFLAAFLIHSLWNAFGVLVGFSPLLSDGAALPANPTLRALGSAAPFALGFLILANLLILWWANRRLRRVEPQVVPAAE
jgi:hypothetical protein